MLNKDIVLRIVGKCMKVATYLLENEELLIDTVYRIHSYDGSLDDIYYEDNDEEFYERFNDKQELARAVNMGDFRITDEFVRVDGAGNLQSLDNTQYAELLSKHMDEIIDEIFNKKNDIDFGDEKLVKLINESC